MANEEHLRILKRGVKVWNRWREGNLGVQPDLNKANLKSANLGHADLSYASLIEADLRNADLNGADLSRAFLYGANLAGTNLSRVNLRGSVLDTANLEGANVRATIFVDVDLRGVQGLNTVHHAGPSSIGIDTIYRSKGKVSEVFLRGVGVPDPLITYVSSLTGEAIQYYSCFISYSHKDETFAQLLYTDLQSRGVRSWFAPEDMKIGQKIRSTIDLSIRVHDKLLLILSERSINSDWVETEVETAFEEERKRGQTVLFPVGLDEAVMETDQAWAADIRRTRHIGDFHRWKDHDAYQQAFERLLRDLKAKEQAMQDRPHRRQTGGAG